MATNMEFNSIMQHRNAVIALQQRGLRVCNWLLLFNELATSLVCRIGIDKV